MTTNLVDVLRESARGQHLHDPSFQTKCLYWQAADEIERLHALLKAVQTDAGNWLHQDLQAAIEEAVGPAGPYRPLGDSGLKSESEP